MTLGSLFDGLGGWQLAAVRAGIKPVWSSEIDNFCCSVTARHFPETIQLGDINNITEPPHADIITAGSPCFPAGTLIITSDGYCPIEDIKVDDRVLTHTGKWQRVLKIGSRFCNTVILKGFGHPGLETTANHPFYSAEKISRWNNARHSYDRFNDTPKWTPAQNMCGLFWATPVACDCLEIPPITTNDIRENPPPTMDDAFWWMVGRWLGDGWVRNGQRPHRKQGQTWGQVFICCSYDEKTALEQRLKAVNLKWSILNDRTVCKFRATHSALVRWLIANFGEKADGKKIPAWVLSLSRGDRQSLLDGYFSADGWRRADGTYSATTVSKTLALGIRLIAESLGYSSPLYLSEVPPTKIIEGRLVRQKNFYTVRYSVPKPSSSRVEAFGVSWGLVRSVALSGTTKQVFNLEVEHDNSYCAENIIVHNCQDVSIAGKRSGINGSRSGLFFRAVELVRRVRPQFFVWENVPGAFNSNGGNDFRTVLEEILQEPVPLPRHWSNAGVVDGRHCQISWRILDAQFWGVPQRRRRIFLVADFTARRAAKILFEPASMSRNSAPSTRKGQDAPPRIGEDIDFAVYENHGQDSRIKRLDNVAPTVNSKYGTGGNNIPIVTFGIGRDAFNQGRNAKFKPTIDRELQPPHGAWCRRLRHAQYRQAAHSLRVRKVNGLSRRLVCGRLRHSTLQSNRQRHGSTLRRLHLKTNCGGLQMKFRGLTPKGERVTGRLIINHPGAHIFDGKQRFKVIGISIRPLPEDANDPETWQYIVANERRAAS